MSGQKKGGNNTPSVSVSNVVARTIVEDVQSVANVESPFKVEISPKISGRIAFLQAREGDAVTAGQVLLQIDPSDLQGAVLQQQANVAEARARLSQAKMTQQSTTVGVTSQIQQQEAILQSARATLNQVQQNYSAQLAGAQAQITSAQSAVANAVANKEKESASLRNAQSKYERSLTLYKQGFIAAQDLDDARTAVDVQKSVVDASEKQVESANSQVDVQKQNASIVRQKGLADIAAGKASVSAAQAALRTAQANRSQTPAYQENLAALQSQVDAALAQLNQSQARIADTTVKSPIAGTITARKADPGALASPGSPVLEVQFLDWIYVTATLPLESGSVIRAGDDVNITLDALPGKTYTGPITNLNAVADPQSRQFGIKVRVSNLQHVLRPGMYGHVSIITRTIPAKVVAPREAIHTADDGTSTVVVVDDKSVAHIRTVTLGARDSKGVQVLTGVNPGENVVVLTFNQLKDNQKVRLSSPTEQAGSGTKSGRKGKKPTKQ